MIAVITDAKVPNTKEAGNTLSFFDSYTTMVLPKPSIDTAKPTFAIDIKNPNSPYSFFVTIEAMNIQKIPKIIEAIKFETPREKKSFKLV